METDIHELDLVREIQMLRAHRRLSTSDAGVIDPDLSGTQLHDDASAGSAASMLSGVDESTPSTPSTHEDTRSSFSEKALLESAPIFGSANRSRYLARRQMRQAQAAEAAEATGKPDAVPPPPSKTTTDVIDSDLWVPASVHAELSHDEFRTFMKEQAARNVQHNTPIATHALDTQPRYMAHAPGLMRRSSSLRRQFTPEDVPDGKLPSKSAADAALQSPASQRHSGAETKPVHDPEPTVMRADSVPPRRVREHTQKMHRKPLPTMALSENPVPSQPTLPPTSEESHVKPAPPPKEHFSDLPSQPYTIPKTPPPPPRRAPPSVPLSASPASPSPRTSSEGPATPRAHARPFSIDNTASSPAPPSRRSDDKGSRPSRKSDEASRTSFSRDRKAFGLSWFGLSKDDGEIRAKKKESIATAPEEESLASPREKETFLTGLFSKRKGHESYDALRHRAKNLFSGSSLASLSFSSQSSQSTPYVLERRFSPHVERALYRLSHVKLANPRRPLYQQVEISNFMFWYLSVVNSAQARPERTKQPVVSNRGNGLSEYDEAHKLYKQGTGPRSIHTGMLTSNAVPMYTVSDAQSWHGLQTEASATTPTTASPTMPIMHAEAGQPAWGGVPVTQDDAFLHMHHPVTMSAHRAPHHVVAGTPPSMLSPPSSTSIPPTPSTPTRPSRGPLPIIPAHATPPPSTTSNSVPSTANMGYPPRSTRRKPAVAHPNKTLHHVQEQAFPTQRVLRHASSSPALQNTQKSSYSHPHPLPLPPLPIRSSRAPDYAVP